MNYFRLICFMILCQSCIRVPKNMVVGLYVSKNSINTLDSLIIKADGSYINSIYRKTDNSTIFINRGKWNYIEGYIILHDFFQDNDQPFSKEKYDFENVLMDTQLPLEWNGDKVAIHYAPGENGIYLEKQD